MSPPCKVRRWDKKIKSDPSCSVNRICLHFKEYRYGHEHAVTIYSVIICNSFGGISLQPDAVAMWVSEYAKFIWASPDILSGKPTILRRTFGILARHFTVKCLVNVKFFARHFVRRDQTPSLDIFKNSPDMSGESGEFRVLWGFHYINSWKTTQQWVKKF